MRSCSPWGGPAWLTGYVAMPLERLTMLVVPAAGTGEPTLVVPSWRHPGRSLPGFRLQPWRRWRTNSIVTSLVDKCVGGSPTLAISDGPGPLSSSGCKPPCQVLGGGGLRVTAPCGG